MTPREHIPHSLTDHAVRFRRLILFAIGDDDGAGGYGMWAGPSPSELEMLDVEGKSDRSCLFRFNLDGTDEIIWRWHTDRWIEEPAAAGKVLGVDGAALDTSIGHPLDPNQ